MIDTAAPQPAQDAPHALYWRTVATSAPHRWIALTTDWRVADRLMRQQCILLPGWPDAPASDWLHGPDAAWWWLPTHGRRVLVTAWSDADAHLASLVVPLIERMRPARLEFRNYQPAEEVNNEPATLSPGTDAPQGPAPSVRNETGHAAAA